jgi:hypothetical protein
VRQLEIVAAHPVLEGLFVLPMCQHDVGCVVGSGFQYFHENKSRLLVDLPDAVIKTLFELICVFRFYEYTVGDAGELVTGSGLTVDIAVSKACEM